MAQLDEYGGDWRRCHRIASSLQVIGLFVVIGSPETNLRNHFHVHQWCNSDIDVYVYGLPQRVRGEYSYPSRGRWAAAKLLQEFHIFLKQKYGEDAVTMVFSEHAITFCTKWPTRHIQFVCGDWGDIGEILSFVDIDCTAVAYVRRLDL